MPDKPVICECENHKHFSGGLEGHSYGIPVSRPCKVKTQYGTLTVCETCLVNCWSDVPVIVIDVQEITWEEVDRRIREALKAAVLEMRPIRRPN